MILRNIIEIDEAKCDGCGLCVPACEEGAIRIVGGKARVVSDTYCDGLGACLGHCPRGAISIVQREAVPFDQAAVAAHLAATPTAASSQHTPAPRQCPGATAMQLPVLAPVACRAQPRYRTIGRGRCAARSITAGQLARATASRAATAPYLRGADLLLVADCVPLACADFHARFLDGRPVAIGLPQTGRCQAYVRETVGDHSRRSSCTASRWCTWKSLLHGLVAHRSGGGQHAGAAIPVHDVIVTVRGQVCASRVAVLDQLSLPVSSSGFGRAAHHAGETHGESATCIPATTRARLIGSIPAITISRVLVETIR